MLRLLRYKTIQARKDHHFDKFAKEFQKDMGYEVPANFLRKGKLFIVINPEGEYVGGFAFVAKHPLRSLEEIPPSYPIFADPQQVGEVTAVWLKDKAYGFQWSIHFVIQAILSPIKYFVYSYPISEVQLGKYYAAGDPFCIYKGPIVRLPGHNENPEPESVEILTTYGIFKIAVYRNWKYLKRALKNLLNF